MFKYNRKLLDHVDWFPEDFSQAFILRKTANLHIAWFNQRLPTTKVLMNRKKSIEAPLGDDEDLGRASSDSDEIIEVLDGVKGIDVSKQDKVVSSHKQDYDGNEKVSLDDETNEVEDDTPDLPDLEKPIDQHINSLSTEEETYRKTPTMLDTTSAITNMLSEIVMEADSREVVGR